MMCVATRFPEAVPLRKITAPAVTKALLKFFSTFGLPKVVQTDHSEVHAEQVLFCLDEGVSFVLFAIRDAKQESLGFSPAELVFGHEVRGPMKVLKEQLVSSVSPKLNVSDFVSQCKERLQRAVSLVKESLSSSQAGMKERFDRKAVKQQFQPGDRVLVLLPAPGSALTAPTWYRAGLLIQIT